MGLHDRNESRPLRGDNVGGLIMKTETYARGAKVKPAPGAEVDHLTGAALDYAVAVAEGVEVELARNGGFIFDRRKNEQFANEYNDDRRQFFRPSTDWAQGGPIIERECIDLKFFGNYVRALTMSIDGEVIEAYAPTALVAAMRCYVAAKLGETVEIPATLNQTEKA